MLVARLTDDGIDFFYRDVLIFGLLRIYILCYFWYVGFNGITTFIGYLMQEPFYTYIIYMICKRIF